MARMQERYGKLIDFSASLLEWRHPLRSMAAMATGVVLSFHPHIIICIALLSLAGAQPCCSGAC